MKTLQGNIHKRLHSSHCMLIIFLPNILVFLILLLFHSLNNFTFWFQTVALRYHIIISIAYFSLHSQCLAYTCVFRSLFSFRRNMVQPHCRCTFLNSGLTMILLYQYCNSHSFLHLLNL